MRSTVLFDVGETLLDETRLWQGWADWLGIPAFTLYGVVGGLVARDEDHTRFLELLRPGTRFADEIRAREEAGHVPPLAVSDLYPDAVPTLAALRAEGWQVVVGGNQPLAFQRLVEELGLPADVVVSSGSLGAAKPDPAFFRAAAAAAGVDVAACVHVGDRVDHDVVAARAAGMLPVHVRRGPWGVLHGDDPVVEHQVRSLAELPALLAALR